MLIVQMGIYIYMDGSVTMFVCFFRFVIIKMYTVKDVNLLTSSQLDYL